MLETGDLFGKSKTCCTTAKVRRTVALDLRNGKAENGLKKIPFLQRFAEIRRYGNTVRKTIAPEADSPVEENLTKEMLAGTGRFFESGR